MKRLVVLDRDGTVIVERGFLGDPAGVELLPDAADAIRRLNKAGFAVAIATNQSGVGRGYYSLDAMHATNAKVIEALARGGARVDAVEFCPHHPEAVEEHLRQECDCRKPRPGMAIRAADRLGVRVEGAAVIGDRLVDVRMGLALGGAAILVLTGAGRAEHERAVTEGIAPTAVVDDLACAVDWLLARRL